MSPRTRIAVHAAVATLLAASALGGLFEDLNWLVPVATAIALVAVGCEGSRLLRLPSALGPLAASALVLVFITFVYASDVAVAGLIPGPAAFGRLGDVARTGFHDISTLAAPVPTRHGLVLLATVGLAAVALVVDLIAVSMRRPALAGLPLLALLAIAASIAPHGAGWLPFTLTATGYLSLLLAESRERLGRWGRAFGAHDRPPSVFSPEAGEPSPLAVLARRIGVTAVGAAVVVPLLVPGLHDGISFGSGGTGTGLGRGSSSSVTTFNPIVRIRDELNTSKAQPLLRVRTDDADPTYLRMTSLDQFDGETWSANEISASQKARVSKGIKVPPIEDGVPGHKAVSQVSSNRLDVHWLAVPYSPVGVKVKGDWRFDPVSATIFSARRTTRELSYRVESLHPQPTPEQLAAVGPVDAEFGSLALPKDLPPTITELATRVTTHATTVFDKAVAIQKFLTSAPFVYDQSAPAGNGNNALETFLFETHRGFCEQYAASMAVLARAVGIPSRVAVGFTRGTQQDDGSWLVTTHDAHAWPELYFSGIGWLPFEPTPRGDGQAVAPGYTQVTPGGTGSTPDSTPEPTPTASSDSAIPRRLIEGDRPSVVAPGAGTTNSGRSHLWWLLLVPVVLALPWAVRAVTRRRRWSRAGAGAVELAHAGWSELRDVARDLGLPWRSSDTPRGTVQRLKVTTELADGPASAALDRLRRAEERARYARPVEVEDPGDLRAAVRDARNGLAATVPAWRRATAVVLPASTLQWLTWLTERAADLLDAVDVGLARLRGRLVGGLRGTLRRA